MTSIRLARLMAGVCAATFAMVGAARAQDSGWSFATGLNYTSGDYGEAQDTTVYAVPFSAGYAAERWSFSVSVPWVSLEGSGNIVPGATSAFGPGAGLLGGGSTGGGGGTGAMGGLSNGGLGAGLINPIVTLPGAPPPPPPPGPPPPPVTVEEQGLGDATVSFAFTPFVTDSGGRFVIGADARLPTGDEEKSLGAGEVIGALSLGYVQPFGDSAFYAAIGYQNAFDSEVSGTSAAIGLETQVSDRWSIGAGVDWSETDLNNVPNASAASLYAGFDLTERTRMAVFAQTGLSEASPDVGFGVRLVLTP